MVLNNPISNNDMLGLDLGGDGTPYGYDPTQPGPHNGYEPDPTYPPGKGPADYEPAPMPPPLKQAECCKDGKKTMYQPDIQCCRDGEVISQIPRWQDEGGTLIDCINRLVQTEDGGNGAGITTAEAIGAGVGGAIGGKAAGGKGAAAGGVAGWEAGANAYRAAMRNLCLMLQCPSKK